MTSTPLAWIAIGLYALGLLALALRGARKTDSVEGFAVGNRDIPPSLIGLSLIAQLTSVATFVINPGLVFHSGVAALMGFGLAAAAGITLGLVVFSARFRRVGSQTQALTLPQWIGKRYGSEALRGGFSLLSLGLVAYAVLIVVALSLVLSGLLGVPPQRLVVGILAFVLLCIGMGGANSGAWTNAAQAILMLVVALLLIGAGLPLLWEGEGLLATLAAQDADLVTITNPRSLYFRSLFEVFGCNFLVGIALVCQPHIVSKALYLESDKQVRTYLGVALAAGVVFLTVLVVGLYARASVDPATRVDLVVPVWIGQTFSPAMQVAVAVGLLSAGLSTLEGIFGALAGIFAVDVHPLLGLKRGALAFGRGGLVLVAVSTGLLAWRQLVDPTGGTVAIFAQYGVYLLFTAAFFPLACGMFLPTVSRLAVTCGVVGAVLGYLLSSLGGFTMYANNPAFLATVGLGVGGLFTGLTAAGEGLIRAHFSRRSSATT